jgi:hypothetical protein
MEPTGAHTLAATCATVVVVAALGAALPAAAGTAPVTSAAQRALRACPVTIPTRVARHDGTTTAASFNHGGARLRVHLFWSRGTLAAGTLPDGGTMADIAEDGSIHLKLGWWRGVPGRLVITGRRLDGPAPALVGEAAHGYGPKGFQPSGIRFPRTGCWRVVGRIGSVRLGFVVRLTKLRQ